MLMLWVNLCLLATRSLVDLGVLNARAVDWCRCCDAQIILQNHFSSKGYDSKYKKLSLRTLSHALILQTTFECKGCDRIAIGKY
jgi:hypothetical protein